MFLLPLVIYVKEQVFPSVLQKYDLMLAEQQMCDRTKKFEDCTICYSLSGYNKHISLKLIVFCVLNMYFRFLYQ